MSPTDCIFCRIIAGDIPSHKVYEDEHVYAFLDIGPLSEGHTLIVPKQHAETLDQLSDDAAAACGLACKKIGAAVAAAMNCPGWNVLQNNGAVAGQEVMHVHFHLIPRAEGDGLGYRWHPKELEKNKAESLKSDIVTALKD